MEFLVGCDHAGFETKNNILKVFSALKIKNKDYTPLFDANDDYPDFAQKVAKQVAKNKNTLGVLVCGTGIGMSISANKIKGIRAALCHTAKEATLSRKHNNANILVLAGRDKKNTAELKEIIKAFSETKFEEGRHLRRINKIKLLEK